MKYLKKYFLYLSLFIIAIILIIFFGWRFQWEINIPFFGKVVPVTERKNVETISSFILYTGGSDPKIEILNRGTQNIYLYGTQFDNEDTPIMDEKRIIPAGYSYFLNVNPGLAQWIETNIGKNGEKQVSFNIFLADINQEKYIMKNILYIRVINDGISIQPQTLSLNKENW